MSLYLVEFDDGTFTITRLNNWEDYKHLLHFFLLPDSTTVNEISNYMGTGIIPKKWKLEVIDMIASGKKHMKEEGIK